MISSGEDIHYPYGSRPLLPAWRSAKARALAALALGCSIVGSYRAQAAGLPPNDIALLTVFPAVLAFTLAFAPEARTRLGTMAKDLLCLGTALSPLVYWTLHYLILGVPILLACAVTMDRLMAPGIRVPEHLRRQAKLS